MRVTQIASDLLRRTGLVKQQAPPQPSQAALTRSTNEMLGLATIAESYVDPSIVYELLGNRYLIAKMENDDEIGAALETRLTAAKSLPVRIVDFDDDDEVHSFLHQQINQHHVDIIDAAWEAVPHGKSVFENVYRFDDDGKYRIDCIVDLPPDVFILNRLQELRMKSKANSGEPIDTFFKFIVTCNRKNYYYPEGRPLLHRVYWPWTFRQAGWQFWARFMERAAQPLLVGKGRDPDQLAKTLAMGVQSAVIAIADEDNVDSIPPGSQGQAYKTFSDALDRRIQKTILGQTMTTDVGDKGALATARVHDLVRRDRLMSDARMLTGTFQKIVNALTVLNFEGVQPPKVVVDAGQDLGEDRARRDEILSRTGVRFSKEYFLGRYDLEDDDFEVTEPTNPAPTLQLTDSNATRKLSGDIKNQLQVASDSAAADDIVDQALTRAASPLPTNLIKQTIEDADSPEDLIVRLAELASDFEPKRFQQLMEASLLSAQMTGAAAITEENDLQGVDPDGV